MIRLVVTFVIASAVPLWVAMPQENLPRGDVRPGPETGPNETPNLLDDDNSTDKLNENIDACVLKHLLSPNRYADPDIIGQTWGADIINPVLRETNRSPVVECLPE